MHITRTRVAGVIMVLALVLGIAGASRAATSCDGPQYPPRQKVLLTDIAKTAEGYVAVGDDGHVNILNQGGKFLCAPKMPVKLLLTAVSFPTPEKGWVVGYDGVVLNSEDGGITWQTQVPPAPDNTDTEPFFTVKFLDEKRGLAAGAYGTLSITRDGGLTWVHSTIPSPAGEPENRHIYSLVPIGGGSIMAVGESGEPGDNQEVSQPGLLYRSNDAGASWSAMNSPYKGNLLGGLSLGGGRIMIFGLRGHVFASNDDGGSWRQVATETTASIFGALQDSPDTVFLFGSEGTMLRYRWGEATAEALATGDDITRTYLAGLPLEDNKTLLMVGNDGVDSLRTENR